MADRAGDWYALPGCYSKWRRDIDGDIYLTVEVAPFAGFYWAVISGSQSLLASSLCNSVVSAMAAAEAAWVAEVKRLKRVKRQRQKAMKSA